VNDILVAAADNEKAGVLGPALEIKDRLEGISYYRARAIEAYVGKDDIKKVTLFHLVLIHSSLFYLRNCQSSH